MMPPYADHPTTIRVVLSNEQSAHAIDADRLCNAVRMICQSEGQTSAEISLAVVDGPTMHRLNREFLDHDYPTDVLSFVLEPGPPLEGEVIVSAQQAAETAADFGLAPEDELLLYVIHGTLHLIGYDDHSETDIATMRAKEQQYLRECGVAVGENALSARDGGPTR